VDLTMTYGADVWHTFDPAHTFTATGSSVCVRIYMTGGLGSGTNYLFDWVKLIDVDGPTCTPTATPVSTDTPTPTAAPEEYLISAFENENGFRQKGIFNSEYGFIGGDIRVDERIYGGRVLLTYSKSEVVELPPGNTARLFSGTLPGSVQKGFVTSQPGSIISMAAAWKTGAVDNKGIVRFNIYADGTLLAQTRSIAVEATKSQRVVTPFDRDAYAFTADTELTVRVENASPVGTGRTVDVSDVTVMVWSVYDE
jgi:hypothetical protein